MNLGENIHNAFEVVYKTFQSIEKLMLKCKSELDEDRYYMPVEKFLRYSSDQSWQGWIYWSFILLFQRKEDGSVMENGWINAPIYAVEINVDADTCEEPLVIIAKMDFGDLREWSAGCSPSNHGIFYSPIHGEKWFEEFQVEPDLCEVVPEKGDEEKVGNSYWGFRRLVKCSHNLVDVRQENYKEIIFGSMERLSTK